MGDLELGTIGEAKAVEIALDELELVYAFIYSRVGNRPDAEDLTQLVALKALPRLSGGRPAPAIRGYLFATARSVLAVFWAGRQRVPEAVLGDDLWVENRGDAVEAPVAAIVWVEQTLGALPLHYRQLLELRFLQSYSLKEVAEAMGKTVGAVKVMQLRALRMAAVVTPDHRPPARRSPTGPAVRPERRPLAVSPGFASAPAREAQAG